MRASRVQNLELEVVLNRKGRTVTAICGGVAVLALAVAVLALLIGR
jgi:hypothetical protein